VWSFGISMIEIATGHFPYQLWATPFEQLKQVSSIFTFRHFVFLSIYLGEFDLKRVTCVGICIYLLF
jgi:hypothetical protein